MCWTLDTSYKLLMKKNIYKRVGAFALAMVIGILPTMANPLESRAETLNNTQFATKDEMMGNFNLQNGTSATIKFGNNHEWLVAGKEDDNTLVLLSNKEFGESKYGTNSRYSDSIIAKQFLPGILSGNANFSESEKSNMKQVTVSTEDWNGTASTVTGKLYIPDAINGRYGEGNNLITVGSKNNIQIDARQDIDPAYKKIPTYGLMILRSPWLTHSDWALSAVYNAITNADVTYNALVIVPVFHLDMSNVSFASTANMAASEGDIGTSGAMTVRYKSTAIGSAVINSTGTNVSVENAPEGTYLVVQNSSGAFAKKVSGSTTINASDITLGGSSLTAFRDCKVWLEKANTTERISNAALATQAPGYEVTITPGYTMKKANSEDQPNQRVEIGTPISPVVYKTYDSYYYPENYGKTENGLLITRDSASQITVSGTPTDNVSLKLDNATVKGTQQPPSVSDGIGKINGTDTTMEYHAYREVHWTSCGEGSTPVKTGTWYVRYKKTDTKRESGEVPVTVTWKLKVTPKVNMTKISGDEEQTGTTNNLSNVMYQADDGYYFPEGYGQNKDGVSVTRNDASQITISGKPTGDVEIILAETTMKTQQSAPEATDAIGKIDGTATTMEYAQSEKAEEWTDCTATSTTVLPGTWYVRYKETGTQSASPSTKVTVTWRLAITPGADMIKLSGEESQTGSTAAMADVVYKAVDGYYFPDNYEKTENGITIKKDNNGQITLSGNPTGDIATILDGASIKLTQEAPKVTDAIGKLGGTATTMEYAESEEAEEWLDCTATSTTVLPGTWYVRYKETGTQSASPSTEVTVTWKLVITPGAGMIKISGEESQTGTTAAMADVVYKAADGYYFPDGYGKTDNGITIKKDNDGQITLSGNLTGDIAAILDGASIKLTQEAPTVTGGAGTIKDTEKTMEYAKEADATEWTQCSSSTTYVAAGKWYVRYKETGTQSASPSAEVTVAPAPIIPVIPEEKPEVKPEEKPDKTPQQIEAEQIAKITSGVKNTSITRVKTAVSKGEIKLTWNKSKGYKVDGYIVYRTTGNNPYKKMISKKGSYYVNSKALKKGTTYKYKIVGFRKVDGKTVYSKSAILRVKAK